MSIFEIIAIAIALAVDAFAVVVASGITLKKISLRQTFRLSWHFGLFQAFMPSLGWVCGIKIRSYIENFDHWVAFGLLALVALNMIKEAYTSKKDEKSKKDPTKG